MKADLFTTSLNYIRVVEREEDDDTKYDQRKTRWQKFFDSWCSEADLKRLNETDLEKGYNENDLQQKKSFFVNLPFDLRLDIVTEYVKNHPGTDAIKLLKKIVDD